ncbi:MAG: methylated-DNA--[protein]-cysteine S-methyltransferase [Methyloversatilis sp.]|jgi:methylated-DNA-[protein]-cysteine S-methyltransferase|nr:methylated-DNA--[protein]-cysteine S-methyltransferase [Methyloversatilis sp.]
MKEITKHNIVYTCIIYTPIGAATVSAVDDALTGLWFMGQKYYPSNVDVWVNDPDYPIFKRLRAWLSEYFSGINNPSDLRLEPQGTVFQKAVWNILLKIPYGQVATYGEIAKTIAIACNLPSMSAQAIGGAVGHNPISILIPCHRVVGSNRSLTGYAGGLDKKEYLLRLENINLQQANLDELSLQVCE